MRRELLLWPGQRGPVSAVEARRFRRRLLLALATRDREARRVLSARVAAGEAARQRGAA